MCGIAGLLGYSAEGGAVRLRAALARLEHRGPDDEGMWVGDGFAIGMRRLSIIDLQGGDQPIWNEDRSVGVVCNGELYNFVELVDRLERAGHRMQSLSDINVLPHLYEDHGVDAVQLVRGMFAAALWDNRERKLTLWRDRVGKKPLFYAPTSAGLAFASELDALLPLLDERPPIDWQSVTYYLQLGFVPQPRTIYSGVHVVPAAGVVTWSEQRGLEVARFWHLERRPTFTGSREGALEAIDEQLREAVKIRLRSDVPIGVFLSGGIDSGLVAAHAAAAGAEQMLAFVVEVDDPALNEAPAAMRTAAHLGLPIERIRLEVDPVRDVMGAAKRYGQPFADSSAMPSYAVAKAAAGHRKVVLNGDGGDEVFAGYRRYKLGAFARALSSDPGEASRLVGRAGSLLATSTMRRSAVGFVARALRGAALAGEARYLAWTTDLLSSEDLALRFPQLPPPAWGEPGHPAAPAAVDLASMLDSDFGLVLCDDLLVKMDIATMANSVEARSPLLDVPLIELVASLPLSMVAGGSRTKPLLRDLARRYLPREIARAPKRGFEVPVGRWLGNELRPLVREVLLAPGSRVGELCDSRWLFGIVEGTVEFPGNRASMVWAFLMLELFLRDLPQ